MAPQMTPLVGMLNASFLCLLPKIVSPTVPCHSQLLLDCILHLRRWKRLFSTFWLCYWTRWQQLICPKTFSAALAHPIYMPFSPYHLPSVIFHLLGNPPTSLHYIKGAKINHLDNRPYSLLPFFCNVMDSIITVDTKSLLFSTNIISDHQFCFRSDHSTLDMLPLLTQQ